MNIRVVAPAARLLMLAATALSPVVAMAQVELYGSPPSNQGSFVATAANVASVGAELVTNGTFTGGLTGWTAGTGWTYASNSAVWTVGSTPGALTQTVSVVAGTSYLITWDQNNNAATLGTITPSLGSVSGQPMNFLINGLMPANEQILVATVTGNVSLSFLATQYVSGTTGTITLDNVSLKAITPALPTLRTQNVDGTLDTPFYSGGTAADNLFIGTGAGQYHLNGGYQNVGIGSQTLSSLTTGYRNVGVGFGVLSKNTIGYGNTGLGLNVLHYNIMGHENTAVGDNSMVNVTTGSENTAIGTSSLENLLTGWDNHADGNGALASVTDGSNNVGLGENAMASSNGSNNLVAGWNAAYNPGCSSATCSLFFNTILGRQAAPSITNAASNLIIGDSVAPTLTVGSGNILIGVDTTVDVPSPSTSGYLNLANIIKTTGIGSPSTSATNIAGSFSVTGTTTTIGNVGIGPGVTNPTTTLQIADSNQGNAEVTLGTPTTSYYSAINQNQNYLDLIANGDQSFRVFQGSNTGSGAIRFFTAGGSTGNTERARLDSSGRFGIGTTIPAYPLDVSGAANATSYRVGGVAGVSCTGVPTSSAVWTNGIRTTC